MGLGDWLRRLAEAARTASLRGPDQADPDADLRADGTDPVREFAITRELDLHTFQPRDIRAVVEEYLQEARNKGFGTVRLIHGRGMGFQRQEVQKLLAQHPGVRRFWDDHDARLGATWAELVPGGGASLPGSPQDNPGTD